MKRIDKIDILRAFGIILMIAGHTFTFWGIFDRYIHTFHMPLFFIISGFLYKSKNDVPVIKIIGVKAERLLLPYVTFAAVNYAAWFFIVRDTQVWYEPLVKLVTYNTNGLPICGALWFLTALFWTEIFYAVIDRIFKTIWIRSTVVFIIALCACIAQNYTEFRLPLTIDIGLACLGFYEIGRLYKAYGTKLIEKVNSAKIIQRVAVAALLLIINAVLAFVNAYVNIKSGWYGNIPLFWINAILGTAAYYILASLIETLFNERNIIRTGLVKIGKGSIIFLGFNQLMIIIYRYVFQIISNKWIQGTAVFVFATGTLFVLYMLLNRISNRRIRIFLGI